MSAVDRIDVVYVGTLPKIGCMSSRGIRNWPILNLPHGPWKPTNVSRPPRLPLLVSPLMLDSIWKIADSPPPSASVPRTPKRDEFELSRLTRGFEPSGCRPLTNSRSTLSRPYSTTFAVCACAASGAPRTPATATATSFFFIESLLYRKNLARKQPFAPAIGPSHYFARSCDPLCQTAESIGKARLPTRSSLSRAVVPKQQAPQNVRLR